MKKNMCKAIAILMAVAMVMGLSACGSGSGYNAYATAYQKVAAQGGMDVDLSATMTMNGETKNATGNFKVDNSDPSKTILYLEMDIDGETTTQFSDGEYLYTDARGNKMKYKLGEKVERSKEEGADSNQGPAEGEADPGAPTFDTDQFLSEFASFIEAGKIKDMGLLEALPKAAVSETTVDGNVYTLKVSDTITEKYLNTLSQNVMVDEEESVEVKDLKDFTYKATVEDGCVTKLNCSASMTVIVPASINNGEEASYDLTLDLTASFNNPGQAVTIDLPDTAGYKEG